MHSSAECWAVLAQSPIAAPCEQRSDLTDENQWIHVYKHTAVLFFSLFVNRADRAGWVATGISLTANKKRMWPNPEKVVGQDGHKSLINLLVYRTPKRISADRTHLVDCVVLCCYLLGSWVQF